MPSNFFTGLFATMTLAACLALPTQTQAQVRITEFMSEGQGDALSGNGGRRQREFFELTNLGSAQVDISAWSYNDNNSNDPLNFGASFGVMAGGESIILTQMTAEAFRSTWGLAAAVRVFSIGGLSNLGNADTINIYNSATQNAGTLVDTLSYLADARGSGVSRNRPFGGTGTTTNDTWLDSFVGDTYDSRLAPNPPAFAGFEANSYADLANPGIYAPVPEPAGWVLMSLGLLALRQVRRRA